MPNRHALALSFLLVLSLLVPTPLMAIGPIGPPLPPPSNAIWTGASGFWSDPSWSSPPAPGYPNNSLQLRYDVLLPLASDPNYSPQVTVDVSHITVNTLTLADYNNGSVYVPSGNTLTLAGNAAHPTSSTLRNEGWIDVASSGVLELSGASNPIHIVNYGGISIEPGGQLALSGGADVHLWGDGNLYLDGAGALVSGNGTQLYNESLHLIDGAGTIQNLTLLNHGTVNADWGDTLEIQIGAGGLHNYSDGTLLSQYGTLKLTVNGSAPIQNEGLIQTNWGWGGVVMQLTGDHTDLLSNSGRIEVPGSTDFPSSLTLVGPGFGPDPDHPWANLVNLQNTGTISVTNSTLTLDGQGSTFHLYPTPGQQGSMVLTNATVTGTDGSQTLQNSAGHTISGWGTIQNLALSNDGTIDANVSGQTLTIPGAINTGTIQASAGTLKVDLGGGALINWGGTIQTAGGNLVFDASSGPGGFAIQNLGSIDVSGGNTLTILGSNVLGAVNDGTVSVGSGSSLILNGGGLDIITQGGGKLTLTGGTIQGSGVEKLYNDLTVVQDNQGNWAPSGHTIDGDGTINNLNTLVNDPFSNITANNAGKTLTIEPAAGGNFINAGLLEAKGGNLTLDLSAGGQFQNTNRPNIFSSIINDPNADHHDPLYLLAVQARETYGEVRVDNGSTMTIQALSGGSTTILDNGAINLNSTGATTKLVLDGGGGGGATFQFTYDAPAGTTGSTGAITLSAGSEILGAHGNEVLINGAGHTIQGSGIITNLGFDNYGTLRAAAGGTLEVAVAPSQFPSYDSGTHTMSYGYYEAAGIMQLPIGDIVTNDADIVLSGTGDIQKTGGGSALTWLADNRGLFELRDNADFTTSSTQFTNEGQLIVEPGSSFTVDLGEFIQTAGGTTNVIGTLNAASVDIEGGTLEGGGSLDAASVTNGGVFSPGNSIATVDIQGDYIQLARGELDMEIGLVDSNPANDELIIGGSATLAGLLKIIMLGGYEPDPGMSFTLMTYGSWSHGFDSLSLPSWSDRYFELTYGNSDLTLLAVANEQASVPEPVTCLSIAGGLIAIALAQRRRRSKALAF